MNQDDIIRMAREADLPPCHTTHPKALKRFAALVAAAEREACAKEADKWIGCDGLAAAIRARGQ